MGKFDHYKVEVTKDTTQECTLYGIMTGEDGEGEPINPILIVRPAWDINTDYANARIKVSKGRARSTAKKGVMAGDIRRIRTEDRPLYADHVVVGWKEGTVLDNKGKPVEFTQDDATDFLKAIPDNDFDELREFCNNHVNWGQDPLDGEDVVGNSSSD